MKGTIYLVPFGKQKATEFLFQQAIRGISGNDFSDILYIGPTPRKIRDAQITFANLIPADGFIPPKFFTIKQFTNELFLKYCQDYKKLPDYLKPLLIQKVCPDISIGYAKLIAEFIRETKQYLTDYTDADLEKIILTELINKGCQADDDIYRRIQNALSICAQYNQLLKTKQWLDAEDVGLQSLELINNVEVKILVLDGFFYDLTKLEEKIVTALINRAEKVYALSFYDERIPEAYALPQEFLVFLRKLNLFQEEKISEHVDIRSDLPYYVCPSIEEEVEFIASRIKYEYHHQDLSLNRTLVTFSQLDEYETTVRRIFDKYQIPYSLDTTKYLSKTQPVIAVLTLLRAIVNDFPRLETVAVLSSKYFNRFSQETKDVINYFSKKAGIIKTANQWKSLGAALKAIFKEENKLTPALTKKINRAQQELNTLLALSERFPKQSATLSEFTQSLRQLLAQFQWCQGELDDEITTIKNEFYNVLAIIENFELDFGKTLIPLQNYLKILEYFLDQTEILPATKTEGVSILGFLETRGLDCDYLFFGGLSEDKFPGQGHFDPILPEWLKRKLQLPSLERHLMRMRFHYFRLVNTARLRTVLSFYNTDQDRVFLPSPYISGEAQPPIKYNAIFSQEQLQRELGEQEKINIAAFITPVDFSDDPAVKKILSQRFGPTKKISVTTLEEYARCPYRFYLENVIEVETLDEPEYQIEPTLWGNIAHSVFEKLYKTGTVSIEEIPQRIDDILNAVLKEYKLNQFWQDVGRKIFHEFIPHFIRIEQKLRSQGYSPFSIENRLQAKISPDINITGKIDRLDKNQNNQLIILDYKTGKVDSLSPESVESGINLQLPLYGYLAKKKFSDYQIADAGFYSLVEDKIIWLKTNNNDIDALINIAIEKAIRYVGNIRNGQFHLQPTTPPCWYCTYQPICPIQLNPDIDTANENNNQMVIDNA